MTEMSILVFILCTTTETMLADAHKIGALNSPCLDPPADRRPNDRIVCDARLLFDQSARDGRPKALKCESRSLPSASKSTIWHSVEDAGPVGTLHFAI